MINGMSCYSCVTKIERSLKSILGVEDVLVNLEMKKGKIIFNKIIPSQKKIIQNIKELGYEAYFYQENNKEEEMKK